MAETTAEAAPDICDHTSVGVIVEDVDKRILLFERVKPPFGIAPPAGHIDDLGTPQEAAVAELEQETGLVVALDGLAQTIIQDRRVNNRCRRSNSLYHIWNVYTANEYTGEVRPKPDESKKLDWYTRRQVLDLAHRTDEFEAGHITSFEWRRKPGLEPVWRKFFVDLGFIPAREHLTFVERD
jgi:ADP-ribose pyrophosphatase YjhB (NUDIX family)